MRKKTSGLRELSSDGNVPHLDRVCSYKSVYVCQNSNYMLTICYLRKIDFKKREWGDGVNYFIIDEISSAVLDAVILRKN